jgi:hypothetical protein
MKTYLIKIKRDSIKKNPDAGRTYFQIAGPTHITKKRVAKRNSTYFYETLSVIGKEEFSQESREVVFKDLKPSPSIINNWCMVTSTAPYEHEKEETIIENFPFEEWKKLKKGEIAEIVLELNHHREVQTVHTLTPASEWLYDLEDTQVECCYCHNKFSYKDLKSEDVGVDNDGDDISNDYICPKCNKDDCCRIEYEKIEDAVKE